MNASSSPTPIQPEIGGIGGQSVVDSRTAGQDLRLIRRAIVNGWNVSDRVKRLVIEEMALLVEGKNRQGEPIEVDARNKISAARVLVAADSVDARMETADRPTTQVNVNVNNETHINLDGLTDAELEVMERIHRKLAEKQTSAPRALAHVDFDGHCNEPDRNRNSQPHSATTGIAT